MPAKIKSPEKGEIWIVESHYAKTDLNKKSGAMH